MSNENVETNPFEEFQNASAPEGGGELTPSISEGANDDRNPFEEFHDDKRDVEKKPTSPISTIARLNTPIANAEEPELTWGETLQGAAKNFLPSSGRAIKETAKALTVNLGDTLGGIKDIGSGLLSKASGALGVEQDPEEKKKTEALADAIGEHYKKTYFTSGSNFKKALAADPASIFMDLSTPFSGGLGAGAKIAGAGKIAGALKIASKAAQLADPFQLALGTAKLATKPVTALAKHLSALTAQIPAHVLDIAQKAGSTTDPVLRKAFLDHFTGAASPTDLLDTAQSALSGVKSQASKDYLASKAGWKASQATPSFAEIDKALAEARAKTQYLGINNPHLFTSANEALDKADSLVSSWKSNPAAHTIEGFDNLKQAIWDIDETYKSNNQARQAMGGVYAATRKTIGDISPEYLKAMEEYQTSLNEISSIQKSLIGGKAIGKADAMDTVNKILRQQKKVQGKKFIDMLSKQDPEFAYKVAGATLAPWTQSGHRGMLEAIASGIGAAGGYYAFAGHPLGAIGGALTSAAVQAPKITGAVNYASGALGRKLSSPLAKSALYGAEQLRPGEVEVSESDGETNAGPESANSKGRPSWMDNLPSTPTIGAETPGAIGKPVSFSEPFESDSVGIDQAKSAIAGVESRGSGGYNAVGPDVGGGDMALGKYQVMASNVPSWTKKYLGREMTPQQFLKNPKAQELVFEGAFGSALKRYGNMKDAISWWHSGKPLSGAQNKKDILGTTTPDYVSRVLAGIPSSASGGRIGRASGGRAVNHADMAEKLVRQAERVKKVQGEGTEALLDHQDDAIVSALEIANRHI